MRDLDEIINIHYFKSLLQHPRIIIPDSHPPRATIIQLWINSSSLVNECSAEIKSIDDRPLLIGDHPRTYQFLVDGSVEHKQRSNLRVSRNSTSRTTWTADYGSWHLGGLVKVVVQVVAVNSKCGERLLSWPKSLEERNRRFHRSGNRRWIIARLSSGSIFARHYRAAFRLIRWRWHWFVLD